MKFRRLDSRISVAGQIAPDDVDAIARAGYRSIIANRPDGEQEGQPTADSVAAAARAAGLGFAYVPAVAGALTDADADAMRRALDTLPGPVLAYCRSGARAEQLAQMAGGRDPGGETRAFDIVIVGGGSAGIATAASILRRRPAVRIAIIEPGEVHYYQPGWTMVGAGIFDASFTCRDEESLIPSGAEWIRASAAEFLPERNEVVLCDGRRIGYAVLIVCPGITLDWQAIPGLAQTLGRNGVTSNYRYDLAPYTNELVKEFAGGRALFTQPPMPIKCAGAPQKAMYLSCNRWERRGMLDKVQVEFHTAGAALFGVPAYVPALERYVARYGIDVQFGSRLVEIDGPARIAVFERAGAGAGGGPGGHGPARRIERGFDMIHVVPPQVAPEFVRASPLAAASGFVEVDETTLRHVRHANIFGLGDACSASNAKTAAAARAQAPVVAVNALAALDGRAPLAGYNGYGSCPLTVEAGKIVLAEFGYGGRLLPTFPRWLVDGTRPSRLAWLLKDTILPPVYWHGMLRGREWMVRPRPIAPVH